MFQLDDFQKKILCENATSLLKNTVKIDIKLKLKINATVQLNKLENTKKTVSFTINKNKN